MAGKKECEIKIESESKFFDAVWKWSALTLGEINVDNIKDMVNKIEKYKKENNCKCIKKLTICGHGGPGEITIGKTRAATWNKSSWKPTLNKLKGNFCKNAIILLGGCWTGSGKSGAKLLELISNNLGVTVKAPSTSLTQYWDEDDLDVVAKPGEKVKPKKPSEDDKPKKKLKGKKQCLIYKHEGVPRLIETSSLKGFAILMPDEKPEKSTLKKYYNSSKLFNEFVDSLDIFNPVCAIDWLAKIQAHVYFWLEGEEPTTIPLISPSYIVGGYRYLIMGGDWCRAYRLTGGMHEEIREYGRYSKAQGRSHLERKKH